MFVWCLNFVYICVIACVFVYMHVLFAYFVVCVFVCMFVYLLHVFVYLVYLFYVYVFSLCLCVILYVCVQVWMLDVVSCMLCGGFGGSLPQPLTSKFTGQPFYSKILT